MQLGEEQQIVPAFYDDLDKDIGDVLDSEEKSASRGTAESEEKAASKGTSVHYDSPVEEQAAQLPEPSEPAAVRAPPTPWEASPGVKVDWTWRMAAPSVGTENRHWGAKDQHPNQSPR